MTPAIERTSSEALSLMVKFREREKATHALCVSEHAFKWQSVGSQNTHLKTTLLQVIFSGELI